MQKILKRGRKQEDWIKNKDARKETSKSILDAKERYYLRFCRKLSDLINSIKTYCSTLKNLMNRNVSAFSCNSEILQYQQIIHLMNTKSTSGVPPILEYWIVVTNVEAKANILNDYFLQQCSKISTASTIPNFLHRCNTYSKDIAINRCKVLPLIRALDPKKAVGSDRVFVQMIKVYDA